MHDIALNKSLKVFVLFGYRYKASLFNIVSGYEFLRQPMSIKHTVDYNTTTGSSVVKVQHVYNNTSYLVV